MGIYLHSNPVGCKFMASSRGLSEMLGSPFQKLGPSVCNCRVPSFGAVDVACFVFGEMGGFELPELPLPPAGLVQSP